MSDVVLSEESYSYDAAGNITDAPDSCFSYDTNNRLTWYNGDAVGYDADGNMVAAVLNCTTGTYFTYDSANRLISAGGHTYTYNAEDVRIRNLCAGEDTKYTYNTNCKLSKLLWKDTNGTVTKYVYGRGLIGEETGNAFKTYHFDCRGSTVVLTNASGVITDTFAYDTYGGLISRTGTTPIIFGYNGRDGVVTDGNGLIYMRARYYSPDIRRFVNADIVAGAISEAVTLNRFAYANGNPVSNIDPFGLSVETKDGDWAHDIWKYMYNAYSIGSDITDVAKTYKFWQDCSKYGFYYVKSGNFINIKGARSPVALEQGVKGTRYALKNADQYWDVFKHINVKTGLKSEFSFKTPSGKWNYGALYNYAIIAVDTYNGFIENIEAGTPARRIVSDIVVDIGEGVTVLALSTMIGSAVGSVVPVAGNIIGAGVGMAAGYVIDWAINEDFIAGKSVVDWAKEGAGWVADQIVDIGETIGENVTVFFEDAGEWLSNKWDSLADVFG